MELLSSSLDEFSALKSLWSFSTYITNTTIKLSTFHCYAALDEQKCEINHTDREIRRKERERERERERKRERMTIMKPNVNREKNVRWIHKLQV